MERERKKPLERRRVIDRERESEIISRGDRENKCKEEIKIEWYGARVSVCVRDNKKDRSIKKEKSGTRIRVCLW